MENILFSPYWWCQMRSENILFLPYWWCQIRSENAVLTLLIMSNKIREHFILMSNKIEEHFILMSNKIEEHFIFTLLLMSNKIKVMKIRKHLYLHLSDNFLLLFRTQLKMVKRKLRQTMKNYLKNYNKHSVT